MKFEVPAENVSTCDLSKQAIRLVPYDLVTFANRFLQLFAVEYLDVTADVANRSGILQSTRSYGDAFAAYSQHIGNQFLDHNQVVPAHSVMA